MRVTSREKQDFSLFGNFDSSLYRELNIYVGKTFQAARITGNSMDFLSKKLFIPGIYLFCQIFAGEHFVFFACGCF